MTISKMIDDVLIFKNISKISNQSNDIGKRILELEPILFNVFCYLEFKSERGMKFRKKDALRALMDTIQYSDSKLQTMPGNEDISIGRIRSTKTDIEFLELIVSVHKNAVKTNDACKMHLELVSSTCHWLLKECKSQNIPIPKGYKLSKMIENEGFVIKYPKPTGLLQDKEPTFDVTECCDFILRMNISFMF